MYVYMVLGWFMEVLKISMPRRKAQQQTPCCKGLGLSPFLSLSSRSVHIWPYCEFYLLWCDGKSHKSTPFPWSCEWAISFNIKDQADLNTSRKCVSCSISCSKPMPPLPYESINRRCWFCDAVSRNSLADLLDHDLRRNRQLLGTSAAPVTVVAKSICKCQFNAVLSEQCILQSRRENHGSDWNSCWDWVAGVVLCSFKLLDYTRP